jgi:hypothetical protein
LAGAYHENIPLSSYANLNAWQTPWYNNLFSSTAIRAFNIHQASLPPHESKFLELVFYAKFSGQGPIGSEPVGNENQSPLNSNSNHPITSNLPLPPHLLGTYNNYLAPNFGCKLFLAIAIQISCLKFCVELDHCCNQRVPFLKSIQILQINLA